MSNSEPVFYSPERLKNWLDSEGVQAAPALARALQAFVDDGGEPRYDWLSKSCFR